MFIKYFEIIKAIKIKEFSSNVSKNKCLNCISIDKWILLLVDKILNEAILHDNLRIKKI